MANIPSTDLDVFPLSLGGNVFGWTADEAQSFAVLDAYAAAGGNFVDSADVYSNWVPGNSGGESETVIGNWLKRSGKRDDVIIATKVGGGGDGLAPETIRSHADASLKRLGTDRIDLYYAHYDDPDTPLEESLAAFDALVREGKVRAIAASNYSADRLAQALAVSDREGFARYVALQPHYNLVERADYENGLRDLVARENLVTIPYFALAKGFLTGKYRPGANGVASQRAEGAGAYLKEGRNVALLGVLDDIATAHETTVGAVSLAWLLAQPTVIAPIASARTPEQLTGLLPFAALQLGEDELARLTAASS
jgi:aryl-alcohol dehydrogenase-like predicted oxidoreductase